MPHDTEQQLIIGWNAKAQIIVEQYADYVLEGSSIDVLVRRADDDVRAAIAAIDHDCPGLTVSLVEDDPLTVETYRRLEPARYQNVLILSQGASNSDPETVDSETIIILLLLRRLLEEVDDDRPTPSLISEVMNSRNQALVARAGVHDFIISNRLVSMLLAQISEQRDIKRVYDDLFEEDGSEIYLKPASLYFTDLPAELSYADMMAAAQGRLEVCLGVKIKAHEADIDRNLGVKLIPPKTAVYRLQSDDCLVVLAEDDT